MNIKILGGGCTNCKKLFANTEKAIKTLGIEADIEKIEDYKKISEYGVLKTPGLVINEKVEIYGRVPKAKEIEKILKSRM